MAAVCTDLLAWAADRALPVGFDRRLLALRKVHSRRLRRGSPAGTLLCCVARRGEEALCREGGSCFADVAAAETAEISSSSRMNVTVQYFAVQYSFAWL